MTESQIDIGMDKNLARQTSHRIYEKAAPDRPRFESIHQTGTE